MADLIKLKRGQSTTWASKDLLLQDGEPGFELDTHRLKIGDGKTKWNDLPYIGSTGGSIELPDNLVKFLGTVSTLPDEADDGSLCLYKNTLYIYNVNSWIAIIGNSSEQTTFNSIDDARAYVLSHNMTGKVISIYSNNQWLPYIVDVGNNFVAIQYGTDHYDVIYGGNASIL